MNFTFQQKLGMTVGFIGAATSAFGALGPLMTSTQTLIGTVIFGFISACLGVVNTMTSSQGQQARDVANILGNDGKPALRINVNANAPPAIASAAIDPAQKNIGASTPEVRAALINTTKEI